MKKITILLLTTFLMLNAFGQSKEPALEKEIIFFDEGTVYLETGDELNGKIKHSRIEDEIIWFYTEGIKKPKKYKIKDVVKFSVGDVEFVKIKSTTATKFVRYISDRNNKIKLYDATYQSPTIKGGNLKTGFLYPTYKEYWAFFPGMKKAISIKDIMLSRKKVAKYLEDCSELSEKVANKEKGYKISAILSLNTLLETYKRISDEYENCN